MKNIYLVGFMGTGKTTVGRLLARRKKCHFVDLDDLIELKEKRRILDIFAQSGEPYFRKKEKEALKEVAKEKGFIVACGGGVVMDKENIGIMKDSGTLICLSAQPEVILKRTQGFGHRPLLQVKDPARQIQLLMRLRAPYYAQAHKTIDTSKIPAEEVTQRIAKLCIKRKPPKKSVAGKKKKR